MASVAKLNMAGHQRTLRWIIGEDPEWSLALVPLLSNLCLQSIARNFEKKPFIEELLPAQKDYVLERLSPSLPLQLTANLISDEGYWKRCCKQRWDLCDVTQYGHSWKQMYFERHLENLIELFIPEVTDPKTILDVVPLGKNYIKKLNISQLLPPIRESPKQLEDDVSDTSSESGPSLDHFDFGILLDQLTNLEELCVVYRVKGCGMNFEWNLFEFTLQDCQFLSKALNLCKTLKVLRLHQSKVDDGRCRLLVRHLLDHPSLRELDLSHNRIGDRGARAIGKLLNRSSLEALNVCDNNIRGPGAQAIAYALSTNSTLLSLNLRLNRLGDVGGQAISRALLMNRTLLRLHLGSNAMGEPTASVLSQVLAENNTLESINLSCNSLGVDGGTALVEGMSHNTSITECDIRLTEVDQESESCICQVVRNNQNRARRKQALQKATRSTPNWL